MRKASKANSIILIRKTPAGSLAVKLSFSTSVALDGHLNNYLFTKNHHSGRIRNTHQVICQLFYAVLMQAYKRTHFRLTTRHGMARQISVCFNRQEALAIIWLLAGSEYSEFIEIKAALMQAL